MRSAFAFAERRDLLLPRGVYSVDAPLDQALFLLVTRYGDVHLQWVQPGAGGHLPQDLEAGLASILDAIDPPPVALVQPPGAPSEPRVLPFGELAALRRSGRIAPTLLPPR